MSIRRRRISLKSTGPNDWQFADDGELIAPGNRHVAEFISNALRTANYGVSELENHEDCGWEFHCVREQERFWLLVADGDEPGLIFVWIEYGISIIRRLLSKDESQLVELTDNLLTALNGDISFTNVSVASV